LLEVPASFRVHFHLLPPLPRTRLHEESSFSFSNGSEFYFLGASVIYTPLLSVFSSISPAFWLLTTNRVPVNPSPLFLTDYVLELEVDPVSAWLNIPSYTLSRGFSPLLVSGISGAPPLRTSPTPLGTIVRSVYGLTGPFWLR